MFGPGIVARTLTRSSVTDQYGNRWQYHSRSDRHGRVAAFAMLFDLLHTSGAFCSQVRRGRIAVSTKYEMRDDRHDKKKDIDLVVTTTHGEAPDGSFLDVCREFDLDLDRAAEAAALKLPAVRFTEVTDVLVAFEVKAAMTAHVRALTRLFAEVSSSHETIHGAAPGALAVGLIVVNTSTHFTSSDRNRHALELLPPQVTRHRQPADAERVLDRMRQVARRTGSTGRGYDAFAAITIACRNDGTPVEVVTDAPAPDRWDALHYERMLSELARAYEARFSRI